MLLAIVKFPYLYDLGKRRLHISFSEQMFALKLQEIDVGTRTTGYLHLSVGPTTEISDPANI